MTKLSHDAFDQFLQARNAVISDAVKTLLRAIAPTSIDWNTPEYAEDITNIAYRVENHLIDEVIGNHTCVPYYDDNNTPCYMLYACANPDCPFRKTE